MDPTAWITLALSTVGWLLAAGVAWQKITALEQFRADAQQRLRALERFRWSRGDDECCEGG